MDGQANRNKEIQKQKPHHRICNRTVEKSIVEGCRRAFETGAKAPTLDLSCFSTPTPNLNILTHVREHMPKRKKRKARAKKQPKPTFNREENERKMWENTISNGVSVLFGIGKAVYTKAMAKSEPEPEPPKPKTGRETLPIFLRE